MLCTYCSICKASYFKRKSCAFRQIPHAKAMDRQQTQVLVRYTPTGGGNEAIVRTEPVPYLVDILAEKDHTAQFRAFPEHLDRWRNTKRRIDPQLQHMFGNDAWIGLFSDRQGFPVDIDFILSRHGCSS